MGIAGQHSLSDKGISKLLTGKSNVFSGQKVKKDQQTIPLLVMTDNDSEGVSQKADMISQKEDNSQTTSQPPLTFPTGQQVFSIPTSTISTGVPINLTDFSGSPASSVPIHMFFSEQ